MPFTKHRLRRAPAASFRISRRMRSSKGQSDAVETPMSLLTSGLLLLLLLAPLLGAPMRARLGTPRLISSSLIRSCTS